LDKGRRISWEAGFVRTITLPYTNLTTSSICLGTGSLGSSLSKVESFNLLDAFIEQGGNFLDSAKVYADWLPIERSISEKTIGDWMRSRKNRNKIVVGTKGAHPDLSTMTIQRLSPEEITADLDASLEHLATDYIDLYWLHRDDPTRPIAEIIETLNQFIADGKIRYFGCSNWRPERIMAAQTYALEHQLTSFKGNQMLWSLAKVDIEKVPDKTLVNMDAETWEYHKLTGLSAIPYSSQAGGLFTKMGKGHLAGANTDFNKMYPTSENEARFTRIQRVAQEMGLSITQVALGYLLSQPFTTVPIVGCHTLAQLNDSLTAGDITLSTEQVNYLVG
jgi:aryl-alcohol dehydrogenase-like predicted oxidoreductase